jgi:DNA-binding transcriptional LysR family regulator
MDIALAHLDWSKVQAFVAVAETGSLSAAARELGTSQPTLGRQIKSLEEELEVTLFRRQARGLTLTENGTALLGPARAMRDAARAMSLAAAGRTERMAGTVRITASLTVSMHFLPEIIAKIRHLEPEIQIELMASDTSENLLFREADIALRMYRPNQLDVVTKYVGSFALGLFAAKHIAGTIAPINTMEDLLACNLVGYDRDERILRGMRDKGLTIDRTDFETRCDDQNIYMELVRAGCGVGFAPVIVARKTDDLEQVAHGFDLPILADRT